MSGPVEQLREESCRPGASRLTAAEVEALRPLLHEDWKVVNEQRLERTWSLPNFSAGLDLVNQMGAIAEEENHHPDLKLSWGSVEVILWTHTAGGLTRSDFVLAAKYDQLAVTGQS